jgi:hypothetical protein
MAASAVTQITILRIASGYVRKSSGILAMFAAIRRASIKSASVGSQPSMWLPQLREGDQVWAFPIRWSLSSPL